MTFFRKQTTTSPTLQPVTDHLPEPTQPSFFYGCDGHPFQDMPGDIITIISNAESLDRNSVGSPVFDDLGRRYLLAELAYLVGGYYRISLLPAPLAVSHD